MLSLSTNFDIVDDLKAESEVAKLQRQLRIMEADRQAYSLQAREQIRKQQWINTTPIWFYISVFVWGFCLNVLIDFVVGKRQEIDTLLREKEELHRNVGTCKNLSHVQQDSEDTQSLRTLLEQGDRLEEELSREKQSQKEIEKEVKQIHCTPFDGHFANISCSLMFFGHNLHVSPFFRSQTCNRSWPTWKKGKSVL